MKVATRTVSIRFSLLVCVGVLALGLMGCSNSPDPAPDARANAPAPPPNDATVAAPLRFAVLSDSHVKYEQPGDKSWSSIPEQRLANLGPYLRQSSATNTKGLDYKPAFIMSTGDNIADLYGGFNSDNTPTFHSLDMIKKYANLLHTNFDTTIPFYITLGNHDDRQYEYFVGGTNNGRFRYFRTEAAANWYNTAHGGSYKPLALPTAAADISKASALYCYSWKQNGFLLIALNSGAEKKPGTDIYDGESADLKNRYHDEVHFGQEQLDWLSTQFNNNPSMPVIMFWHTTKNMPSINSTEMIPFKNNKDRIAAIFVGHEHAFIDGNWNGIPMYTATSTTARTVFSASPPSKDNATGYDWPDYHPFYLVTAQAGSDPASATVTIDNRANIFKFERYGRTASTTATYPPAQALIPFDKGTPGYP